MLFGFRRPDLFQVSLLALCPFWGPWLLQKKLVGLSGIVLVLGSWFQSVFCCFGFRLLVFMAVRVFRRLRPCFLGLAVPTRVCRTGNRREEAGNSAFYKWSRRLGTTTFKIIRFFNQVP